MIHKVERYIAKHNLLDYSSRVLIALSGGADSVALLAVLQRIGYYCEAVHCNFHLRGEESDRDESFVRELCEHRNINLHLIEFDTVQYAKENGISIEMAARELRYDAFEKLRKKIDANAIAVAHHLDDSAETLLLNLTRGTGIRGLHGIQPKNGYIIRPLLCVGREEITDYLQHIKQEFVTDSTNLTSEYTRNKIRLEVIPKLAEINPSIKESLASTAQRISEAELIYRHAIEEAVTRVKNGNIIDTGALRKEVAPMTLLHEIVSPLGFNSTQVEDIVTSLDSDGGRLFHSKEWSIVKEHSKLVIIPKKDYEPMKITLPTEGVVKTEQGTIEIISRAFDGNIPRQRNTAILDLEKLHMPLVLRTTINGDRFAPFGMRGTKLVSDYLTDRKRNIIEKQQQLVVADATGDILWLVNERPSAHCYVDEKTKNVVIMEWKTLS